MVMSNPTEELIRQLDGVRRYNSKQLEILKELEDNYFEAIEALKELLDEFNTVTSKYEGGSIDRVRELAEKVIAKSKY